MPVRQAAPTFGVSIADIYKALIRRRMTGDAGINPHRGHAPRKLSGAQELALTAHIRSQPGITLGQAQPWLLAEYDVALSTGAIWNAARRLGSRLKKDLRAAEHDPHPQPGGLCPENMVHEDRQGRRPHEGPRRLARRLSVIMHAMLRDGTFFHR
ncbi:transposase [Novosphingobium chloroacetimidivorans]|uniref:Transposase n=1 Tax=Novosphingobium chloroacetimidivorans TaxID=1428314 RepID=A0A7W7NZ05_9SPHN|nr:hypothetical protein [Novosphingobium chloroacetimidivorans]MBB4861109.1 transposase [Novosphingobium chloroacetimidivorans]